VKTAKLIRLEELKGNQVDSPIAVQYADKEWKQLVMIQDAGCLPPAIVLGGMTSRFFLPWEVGQH